MYQKKIITAGLLLASLAAANGFAQATSSQEIKRVETPLTEKELRAIVERGLPEMLGDDNAEVVASLLDAKVGEPVQSALDLDRLVATLFDGRQIAMSDGCRQSSHGKSDCVITSGEAAGTGEYLKLAVHSDGDQINIEFDRRDLEAAQLGTAKLSDASAYKRALEVLRGSLAVSPAEIPQAPANAKNPYPVRSVNLAVATGARPTRVATVEKLVTFQRGLDAGGKLGWVPGPGRFAMGIDDRGINSLSLRDWASMENYGRGVDPADAKSRSELLAELTDRLQREGISRVASVNSVIAVALLEGEETPVPVLRAFVAAQPADLSEAAQAKVLSSAGVVLEIPLLALRNDDQGADD